MLGIPHGRQPLKPRYGLRWPFSAGRAERRPGEMLRDGQGHEQLGQLGVAMLFHEPRHIVGPAPAARLADDRQGGVTKVGQGDRAVSRHPLRIAENMGTAKDRQAQASSLITAKRDRWRIAIDHAADRARRPSTPGGRHGDG